MSDTIPIVCLTDIHGCFYTMLRLLNKVPKPCRLVFLGDLIDRGPHSRQVVEFAMTNKVPTLMGNHCHLALAYHNLVPWRGYYGSHDTWLHNGGDTCLASFERGGTKVLRAESVEGGVIIPEKVYVGPDTRLPEVVLDWMKGLPYYILFDQPTDARDEKGRPLLASHTGYGLETAGKGCDTWFHALWGRHDYDSGEFPDDGCYRVFGHTSVKQAVITDAWANIDSGAAYADRGGGNMTAFIWPSKQTIVQPFDETPVALGFTIEDGRLSR